ncbi:MAG: hypothetical protein CMJ35_11135 [Phycisphaerae bacterium]|nr:hypothetical protein [Phycisphaerae bacterium]MBM92147.1 hypothetical protein [Phycisphaerae bacterium]HCT46684.1 hypothetical protein [Phycisphaerales bacterium]|tara:strand:+ start:162 stop:479 length:318 start_codon:yes stop_codon:yes gene_type:complete
MKPTRIIAITCLALGLGCVSLALGFIYDDFTKREGAWVDLTTRRTEPSEEEREKLLDAWREKENWQVSLMSGTLGVMLLGAGLGIIVFELPWLRDRSGATQQLPT